MLHAELGFSIGVTQLLVIPVNLVGAIAEIASAVVADRMQQRFPLIFGGSCVASLSFFALCLVHNHWGMHTCTVKARQSYRTQF